jgi:hypothetical protein
MANYIFLFFFANQIINYHALFFAFLFISRSIHAFKVKIFIFYRKTIHYFVFFPTFV